MEELFEKQHVDMFNDVLERDERIIKVYKPDKKKFRWSVRLLVWFSTFWLYFFMLIGLDPEVSTDITPGEFALGMFILVTLFILVISLIVRIFANMYYKNRFYAYTNKRIMIRSGIFGIDYRSLEFKSLTATIVNVSLLDKLVKRNTGSIMFASPSSPVFGAYGGRGLMNPYSFKHIYKPYDTLKEIKEFINQISYKDEPKKEQDKVKQSALKKLSAEEKAALGIGDK